MTESDYRKLLRNRLIEYRNCLNVPKNITFGIEIEYENIVNDTLSCLLIENKLYNRSLNGWINKSEIDIAEYNDLGEEMNGEINSPILNDEEETWENLREILNLLKNNNAIITNKCGGHVNIGSHILGYNEEYWRNFLLLWLLYEKEIYKFCSGEYLKVRQRDNNKIEKISKILKNNIDNILKSNNDVYRYLSNVSDFLFHKTHDISLASFCSPTFEENNRIEFRLPNGTLNEEIWQNYINFFIHFLLACKKKLDIDKVIYKIRNKDHNSVELADYIFKEDIDKENFLIQTLKTNKIYKKELISHINYQ